MNNLPALKYLAKRGSKTLPIAGYIKAEDGTLTATDLSVILEVTAPTEKNMLIDHKYAGTPAQYTATSGTPSITDYPDTVVGEGERIKIDVKPLIDALPFTIKDDTRPILTGVYIYDGNVASTDGYRLYHRAGVVDKRIKALIPKETIEVIKRIKIKEDWYVTLSENTVMFETKDVRIISNLIDGNFPQYADLVSKTTDKLHIVDVDVLKSFKSTSSSIELGDTCKVFDQDRNVIYEFDGEKSDTPLYHTLDTDLNVVMPLKERDIVCINPKYLIDAAGKSKKIGVYTNSESPLAPVYVERM